MAPSEKESEGEKRTGREREKTWFQKREWEYKGARARLNTADSISRLPVSPNSLQGLFSCVFMIKGDTVEPDTIQGRIVDQTVYIITKRLVLDESGVLFIAMAAFSSSCCCCAINRHFSVFFTIKSTCAVQTCICLCVGYTQEGTKRLHQWNLNQSCALLESKRVKYGLGRQYSNTGVNRRE